MEKDWCSPGYNGRGLEAEGCLTYEQRSPGDQDLEHQTQRKGLRRVDGVSLQSIVRRDRGTVLAQRDMDRPARASIPSALAKGLWVISLCDSLKRK